MSRQRCSLGVPPDLVKGGKYRQSRQARRKYVSPYEASRTGVVYLMTPDRAVLLLLY